MRIVGNGGTDGNVSTLADNKAYLVGFNATRIACSRWPTAASSCVPQNVTVMIDAGADFKMRRANLNAGTTPQGLVSRAAARSRCWARRARRSCSRRIADDTVGGDSDGPSTGPQGGDYGGIVFRDDSDHERDYLSAGRANPLGLVMPVFLNYVNHATMSYGGGKVLVDSVARGL